MTTSYALPGLQTYDLQPGESHFTSRLAMRPLPSVSPYGIGGRRAWLDATSNTPLIYVGERNGTHIVAKVLNENRLESHYDPAFYEIMWQLGEAGALRPGDDVVEITSGSAGISFAGMASVFDVNAHVIAPPELPVQRLQPMVDLGARVYQGPPGYIPATSAEMVNQMKALASDGYKRLREFQTKDNPVIVFEKGDHRVVFINHSQLRWTIDAFKRYPAEVRSVIGEAEPVHVMLSALGNWTTTTAFAEQLATWEQRPALIGIEDIRHAPIYVDRYGSGQFEPAYGLHTTFGTGSANVPVRFIDPALLSDVYALAPDEIERTRKAWNNGHRPIEHIGNSSALGLAVAHRIADGQPAAPDEQAIVTAGGVIVVPFYDKADRYGFDDVTRYGEWDAFATAHGLSGDENWYEDFQTVGALRGAQPAVRSVVDLPSSIIDARPTTRQTWQTWAVDI